MVGDTRTAFGAARVPRVAYVAGTPTQRIHQALERTNTATPDPKWVVAVGDCALDGGVFAGSYAVVGGVDAVVAVDLHVKVCPPTPKALLEALIALVDKSA